MVLILWQDKSALLRMGLRRGLNVLASWFDSAPKPYNVRLFTINIATKLLFMYITTPAQEQ